MKIIQNAFLYEIFIKKYNLAQIKTYFCIFEIKTF